MKRPKHNRAQLALPWNPNPSGLCQCGCGAPTEIATKTNRRYNWVKGHPKPYFDRHKRRVKLSALPPKNPSGLCMCGCGQLTTISAKTYARHGIARGQAMRFVPGHQFVRQSPRWIVNPETGCWEWQRSLNENGYGQTTVGGRNMGAHRAIYAELYGPIPSDLVLHHTCHNRACVNPAHLEPMSQAEHVRLRSDRKFTGEDVREIRCRAQTWNDVKVLAIEYGVHRHTIQRIRNGRNWKDID